MTGQGEPRQLTIAEIKRLCSFPDDYVLTGQPRRPVVTPRELGAAADDGGRRPCPGPGAVTDRRVALLGRPGRVHDAARSRRRRPPLPRRRRSERQRSRLGAAGDRRRERRTGPATRTASRSSRPPLRPRRRRRGSSRRRGRAGRPSGRRRTGGPRCETLTDTAWTCLDLNASLLATMPPVPRRRCRRRCRGLVEQPGPGPVHVVGRVRQAAVLGLPAGRGVRARHRPLRNGCPARFHVVAAVVVNAEMVGGRRRYRSAASTSPTTCCTSGTQSTTVRRPRARPARGRPGPARRRLGARRATPRNLAAVGRRPERGARSIPTS